jgi:hypothetical protein
MTCRFGYWEEREESFEGVRARTFTVCPAERQGLSTERPVPPVAPKMATVAFCKDDMVLLRIGVLVDVEIWILGVLKNK